MLAGLQTDFGSKELAAGLSYHLHIVPSLSLLIGACSLVPGVKKRSCCSLCVGGHLLKLSHISRGPVQMAHY